ncbi:MAG TPA: DUF2203 domain-containing protein [Candidatus Limnocylindrales bacterium]|nr:DUF2203 domain-containing protein [Candidatus Limnocylindrales bacterium]
MAGERWYSVEEANAMLPKLRPVLERIRDQHAALADDRTLGVIRERAAHNGGGEAAQKLTTRARAIEEDVKQIDELGIVLRDPSSGLIDFYHQREGETVFLCWRLGEPRVAWWHPVETGIAGRQPL